ncbi:MAG: SDR family oxidoreductase, partial [Candidatus Binatia bacterium]
MHREVGDSVVVITGASSGIGRAAALKFARLGTTVVLTSRREEALLRLAERCENLGGRALAMPADVTDQQAIQSLARRAVDAFGRIDVWINNAAVTLFARFENSPPETYRRVIETNLFGCIHGARAALPYFREQGSGTLINISSGLGRIGSPYVSAYAASKFAIIGLSESLRMELQDAPDIHVCTVLPAAIDTPLFQHGANFMGRAAQPIAPIYSAEKVADALVDVVRHPRREIIVGNAVKLGLMMHAIAPGLTERIYAKQVEKKHFQDRPAPPTEGNLFKAMEQYEDVSGGWRAGNSNLPFSSSIGCIALSSLVAISVSPEFFSLTRIDFIFLAGSFRDRVLGETLALAVKQNWPLFQVLAHTLDGKVSGASWSAS